jgi:hypothetical protein
VTDWDATRYHRVSDPQPDCGGKGNLQHMLEHAAVLMTSALYREHFGQWRAPWNFADAEITARRLETAGFTGIATWLEEAPVDLENADKYADFVSCVCIRHHLDRLPPELRGPFTADLTARAHADLHPFTLDYWRLNLNARKPAA